MLLATLIRKKSNSSKGFNSSIWKRKKGEFWTCGWLKESRPETTSKRWPFERKLNCAKNLGLIGSVTETAILSSYSFANGRKSKNKSLLLLLIEPKPTTFKRLKMRLLPSTSACIPLTTRWQLPSLLGRPKLFPWRRAIGWKDLFRIRKLNWPSFHWLPTKLLGKTGSPSLSSKNVGILFKKILSISSRNFIPMVRFLEA